MNAIVLIEREPADIYESVEACQHRHWIRFSMPEMATYPRRNDSLNAQSGNLLAHQDELEIASERLGHASTATTKKFYRSNTSKVVPLKFSHKSIQNS